jgi:hypothetical protein
MTRYQRIAGAVMFALLAWAFIALWVRSYYRYDIVRGNVSSSTRFELYLNYGRVVFFTEPDPSPLSKTKLKWLSDRTTSKTKSTARPFNISVDRIKGVMVPHWFLAVCSFALAAVFAFKKSWRFSVRSILFATTLLAVALGLGVYFL